MKTINIGNIKFSKNDCKKCPKDKTEPFYQGDLCSRCPVFNCIPVGDKDGPYGEVSLMGANEYRIDWAIQFRKYIDREIEYPKLLLDYDKTNS